MPHVIMTSLLMSALWPILLLLLASPLTVGQQSPSGRIKVTPECGQQMITIHLEFNPDFLPQGRFTDWILVGDSARRECRLRGNGELRYVVEIAVFNDPCNTQMVAPGIFQNSLRVAQFPGIILQDDYNFLFKCTYGLPDVQEYRPQINPTFGLNQNPITGTMSDLLPATTGLLPATISSPAPFQPISIGATPVPNSSSNLVTSSSNLVAILLSSLIVLTLLIFLLCLYLCLRECHRRRVAKSPSAESGHYLAGGLESGSAALVGATSGLGGSSTATTISPSGAATGPDGSGSSWWVGKAVGSQQQRQRQKHHPPTYQQHQASKAPNGVHRFLINGHGSSSGQLANGNGNGVALKTAKHDQHQGQSSSSRVAATTASIDTTHQFKGSNAVPPTSTAKWDKEREERQREIQAQVPTAFREALRKAAGKETEMLAGTTPQSYGEWRGQTMQRSAEEEEEGDHDLIREERRLVKKTTTTKTTTAAEPVGHGREASMEGRLPPGCTTPVRSITEIYRSAETHLQRTTMNLEEQARQMDFGENGARGFEQIDEEGLSGEEVGEESSPDEGEYSIPIQRMAITASTRERLAHCADRIRGFGPRKLTEQEIARWRQLIKSDSDLQRRVLEARSVEELKALCELPEYRLYFTRTKWSQIMEQVAEMVFSPHPTETLQSHQSGSHPASQATSLNLGLFKSTPEAKAKRTGGGTEAERPKPGRIWKKQEDEYAEAERSPELSTLNVYVGSSSAKGRDDVRTTAGPSASGTGSGPKRDVRKSYW